jgi:glycosyltransferase involved in cell wall biosynthesis
LNLPFSSNSGKTWTKKLLYKIINGQDLTSILDVGVGSGTYYNLLSNIKKMKWTGVEVHTPYIEKYQLEKKYDTIINQDVRTIDFEPHDIAILGDVLEHMTKEDAVSVYEKLLEVCKVVVISIPLGHYPQDEYEGNPFEKHITDNWTHEEVMATFKDITLSFIENEIGVYVAQGKQYTSDVSVSYYANVPSVGVYIICKNEEKTIEQSIRSVANAHEIVVLDTGSTDSTRDIIRQLQNDLPQLKTFDVVISPWRFDDAKNMALYMLNPYLDLAISLDADEYLCENWKEILSEAYEYGITRYYHSFSTIYENGSSTDHFHERIHSRDGYYWKLPVHEVLRFDGTEKSKWITELRMFQTFVKKETRSNYLPLLEKSVVEDPTVWKSWFFLAQEYQWSEQREKAIESLEKALTVKDADEAFLYAYLSDFYESKQRFEYALQAAIKGDCREYWYYAAMKALTEDIKRALLSTALSYTTRTQGYRYNPEVWKEGFIENLLSGVQK